MTCPRSNEQYVSGTDLEGKISLVSRIFYKQRWQGERDMVSLFPNLLLIVSSFFIIFLWLIMRFDEYVKRRKIRNAFLGLDIQQIK